MNEATVIDLGREALQLALLVAMPMLAASLLIGIVVSVLQVATSIQDATLTFVPKIVGVAVALLVTGHWALRTIVEFTRHLLVRMPELLR